LTAADCAVEGSMIIDVPSRYHGEWFAFTVPAGQGGNYTIATEKRLEAVSVYHEIVLYRFSGEPDDIGRSASTYSPGGAGKVPFATIDTSDPEIAFALDAGETYYFSIFNFRIESFDSPLESGEFVLKITKN
jgi:hypothetical protein